MKKTKIVCTIGPSCDSRETLTELVKNGMNVARLNFAHGSYEDYKRQMSIIKDVSSDLNTPIAILIDIKGPEIRIGELQNSSYPLVEGESIILTTDTLKGTNKKVSVNHPGFIEDIHIGTKVLIDDGLVELIVEEIIGKEAKCRILNDSILKPRKGVNLPGIKVSLPGVTPRDIEHIKFGIENNIDFIAASFVRKAEDIQEIKRLLKSLDAEHVQIISKIENQEGLDNFDSILEASDGIMVARGDLGVEIPIEEVPHAQKMMIKKCNKAGKPVITATQMLDSMQVNPRPTRAEASDVANAILDGSDAIMLSGETAAGKYPVESVKTMANIAERAEKVKDYNLPFDKNGDETEAITQAAITAALDLNAKAIIVTTETGLTAQKLAKYKPSIPVLAVTPNDSTLRLLSLLSGVVPIKGEKAKDSDELIKISLSSSKETGLVTKGDTIVLTSGQFIGQTGSTSMLQITKA